MSNDPWTLETLKVYFDEKLHARDLREDQRHAAQQQAVASALAAQERFAEARQIASEKAILKAEVASEKRFDCVSVDTPILCADLIWRHAGALDIGDEIVAFDEESPSRRGRLLRKATVVANSVRPSDLVRVVTPIGAVRCNLEHPWLVRRPRTTRSGEANGIWAWIKTGDLVPGDEVLHIFDVWSVESSWEAGWLAGMYDGEGCLCLNKNGGAQLTLSQRESKTSDMIVDVLSRRVSSFVTHRKEAGSGPSGRGYRHPFFHFIVSARSDIVKLLGSIRPPRLLPKSDGVWEGKPVAGKWRRTRISTIEKSESGMIAVLGTSTRTYIAAGFAMHNSVNEFRQTLTDQAASFMPRAEGIALIQAVAKDVAEAKGKLDRLEGQTGGKNQSWLIMVAAAGMVFGLVGVLSEVWTLFHH